MYRIILTLIICLSLATTLFAEKKERVLPYGALLSSAKIYMNQKHKDYAAAKTRLQEAIDNYENSVEAYYWLGIIHAEKSEYKEMMENFNKAQEICNKAEETNDKDLKKKCKKGKIISQIEKNIDQAWGENYKLGVEHLEMADSLTEEIPNITDDSLKTINTSNIGKLLEAAKVEFELCTELDDANAAAFYSLGMTYNRLDDKQAAINIFARSHEIEPDNVNLLIEYAVSLYNNKDYETGVKMFGEIAEKDEANQIWALQNQAICYQNMGDTKNYGKVLDNIIEIAPDDANMRFQRGIFIVQQASSKEIRDSSKVLDALEDASPKDKTIKQAQKDLDKYQLSFYKKAIPDFQIAVELEPEKEEHWYWFGMASFLNEDTESARSAYEKCVELNNDNKDCWCSIELVYAKLKMQAEFDKANENCERLSK